MANLGLELATADIGLLWLDILDLVILCHLQKEVKSAPNQLPAFIALQRLSVAGCPPSRSVS